MYLGKERVLEILVPNVSLGQRRVLELLVPNVSLGQRRVLKILVPNVSGQRRVLEKLGRVKISPALNCRPARHLLPQIILGTTPLYKQCKKPRPISNINRICKAGKINIQVKIF